jgi:hypothetical protein
MQGRSVAAVGPHLVLVLLPRACSAAARAEAVALGSRRLHLALALPVGPRARE